MPIPGWSASPRPTGRSSMTSIPRRRMPHPARCHCGARPRATVRPAATISGAACQAPAVREATPSAPSPCGGLRCGRRVSRRQSSGSGCDRASSRNANAVFQRTTPLRALNGRGSESDGGVKVVDGLEPRQANAGTGLEQRAMERRQVVRLDPSGCGSRLRPGAGRARARRTSIRPPIRRNRAGAPDDKAGVVGGAAADDPRPRRRPVVRLGLQRWDIGRVRASSMSAGQRPSS